MNNNCGETHRISVLLSERGFPSSYQPEPWPLWTMRPPWSASATSQASQFCRVPSPCGLPWSSSARVERCPGRSPAETIWQHHAAQRQDLLWLAELKQRRVCLLFISEWPIFIYTLVQVNLWTYPCVQLYSTVPLFQKRVKPRPHTLLYPFTEGVVLCLHKWEYRNEYVLSWWRGCVLHSQSDAFCMPGSDSWRGLSPLHIRHCHS